MLEQAALGTRVGRLQYFTFYIIHGLSDSLSLIATCHPFVPAVPSIYQHRRLPLLLLYILNLKEADVFNFI
jgi:hypothetical protein